MSSTEHFITFLMTDESNKELTGNLRFFKEKDELIFYDKNFNEILIANLNKIPHDAISIKEREIELNLENKRIKIFREKDRHSQKVFSMIQLQIYKLNQPPEEREGHFKNKIIKKPLNYQIEIFEKAKTQNSIIFLETGLGKTYIAVMLLKNLFGEPLETNHFSIDSHYQKKTQKKALFLFKTVSLLLQQSKVLKFNSKLKIIKFYGGSDVFLPSYEKFRGIINRYDVICSTPEVIYKYFTLGFFKAEDLELIIVDECHHAKKSDFMNLIFKHFIFEADTAVLEKMRIIGLTASPSDDTASDQKGIEANIQDLCDNLRSNLICSSILIKEMNDLKMNEKNYEILPLIKMDYKASNFNLICNSKSNNILEENAKENLITDAKNNEALSKLDNKDINDNNKNKEKDSSSCKSYVSNTPQNQLKEYILKELILQESFVNYLRFKCKLNDFCILNKLAKIIFALYSTEEKQTEALSGSFDKELFPVFFMYENTLKNIMNIPDDEFKRKNPISFQIAKEDFQSQEQGETENFSSFEIKLMEKNLTKDNLVTQTTKFISIVNLLIKYTDNSVFESYCISYLDNISKRPQQRCNNSSNFILNFKIKAKELYLSTNKNVGNLNENLNNNYVNTIGKNFVFKSEYLLTLENFFLEKIKNNTIVNNKTIIFLHKRIVTKYICEILNKFLSAYGFTTTFVVGCAKQGSISFSEEELKQNIASFEKDPKCIGLFATNVVEEGIDVPLCDNIINLSEIRSMREFIQKSGRARKSNSTVYTCCANTESDKKRTLEAIKNLKNSIEVMKNIIVEDKIKPKVLESSNSSAQKNEYLGNVDFYETPQGAKVFLSYAKNLVNHFIGKLFNDGFTYIRSEMKVLEEMGTKTGSNVYRPYLNLPNCLEENFIKIFDSDFDGVKFEKKEEAEKYGKAHEDYFYLKAVKFLHRNQYLDDNLSFVKNYDDLINLDYNYAEYKNEPKVTLKQNALLGPNKNQDELNNINNDTQTNDKEKGKEYYINLIDYDPMFIDLNLNRRLEFLQNPESTDFSEIKLQKLGIISEFKITELDFNIFIPATQILLLYWINQNVIGYETSLMEELNMPKISYNYFSKMNFKINDAQIIKINSAQKDLIEFYYVYSLFFSTDAEIAFYYFILQEKFSFSRSLFLSNSKLKQQLELIFEKVNLIAAENSANFPFLKAESQISYGEHLMKISILKGNCKNGFYEIDFEEIENTLASVKKDIRNYYRFLKEYIVTDEDEKNALLADAESIDKKAESLPFYQELPQTLKISRNFLNFSKLFVCNFSEKAKKGKMLINQNLINNNANSRKNLYRQRTKVYSDDETYQMDYLRTYGLISESERDYLKTYCFDFNQRMLKYKINISNLGRVHLKSKKFFIKKFKFLPYELVHEIENCSIDKIFLFGMIPTILYKLQHDLIYYYQAVMLKNRFRTSFGKLEFFKMNLVIEALNSKSTMESQNYERLEFLGDAVLKFLSSFETFVKYPNANRDLLFSKRRTIESNKFLYLKAVEEVNNMDQFLYTSPVNFKRMSLKGFSQEEMFLFNIGLNRSFAKKSLLSHAKARLAQKTLDINDNKIENQMEGENAKNDQNDLVLNNQEEVRLNEEDLNSNANMNSNNSKKTQNSQLNTDEYDEGADATTTTNFAIKDENEDTDKTAITIPCFVNDPSSDSETESEADPSSKPSFNKPQEDEISNPKNLIKAEKLEEFVHQNLEVTPGDYKPSRIISNKVLADFVESLTGYLFYMNFTLFLNNDSDNFFELPSEFLKDLGVLESTFNLGNLEPFWLKDLENPSCKFALQLKLNKVMCLNNKNIYEFKNPNLLFQALSHPESINDKTFAYVNKSYQRLAFLGEAFVSFCVAFYVYDENPNVNECMLHKLKICGINHHIISDLAMKMKLDDLLLTCGTEIKEALKKYKEEMKKNSYDNYLESMRKIRDEEIDDSTNDMLPLDESFVIILCEAFHAWVGAMLLDCKSIKLTYLKLMNIMKEPLKKYANQKDFIEHPKVVILDNFERRKEIFKKIKENGSNRIDMKKESKSIRECKMYEYQLIIDKYIIYEENIFFNRSTIRIAQERAKKVFMRICDEVDKSKI